MPQKYFTKNLLKFLSVTAICLLLIFSNPKGFFDPVRGFFLTVAYPFQKTSYLLSHAVSEIFDFLGSIGELKSENDKLIKENNSLSSKIALLSDAERENKSLREQLGLAPKGKFDLEASFVIGQDPQRLDSWIMIDKGASDGIVQEMPVIAFEGILIGKISEVMPNSSKVSLLSDSKSVVNVVDIETGAKGVLRGEYGLGFIMDMVSQQESLNPGDTVVTSGLGSNLPRGLLVGKIQEVRTTSDKLFQQAAVIPRIRYSKLDLVFVIKK